MTTHFHAGYNMVGYLPELEASYPFEDWDSAKRSLIDDMDRAADDLSALMEDLNLDNGPGWDGYVGYMHYWIVACVEPECVESGEYAR